MFKTPEQLKEFILWAKEHKLKRVKVGTIEVEISDLAFIESLDALPSQIESKVGGQPGEEADKKEEDDLLYWSTDK